MYTPTDLKKSKPKPTLRWVTVNEYWLEISSKPLEAPLITIHLGFANFRPPKIDEPYSINSIILSTFGPVNEWEIVISTNNRFEILDLNEALVQGQQAWNNLLTNGPPSLTFESSFKDKNSGFLGGRSVECSISKEGFKAMRSQNESTLYTFDNVIYINPVRFDTRQGSCFEMYVKPIKQQRQDLLFQCHDHSEMKQFLTLFFYYLVQNNKEYSIRQTKPKEEIPSPTPQQQEQQPILTNPIQTTNTSTNENNEENLNIETTTNPEDNNETQINNQNTPQNTEENAE